MIWRLAAATALFSILSACAHRHPSAASPSPSGKSRRSTFIMGANRAGTQTVLDRGNEKSIDFEYTDRGRGPKTTTRFVLNGSGLPVSVQTTGNDYFKAAIVESFTIENGISRWSNGAERGERRGDRNFYVSMYGPPEEFAILAKALLSAPHQRLPLLPTGEASIRRVGELSLASARRTEDVTLYEIVGLGFTPQTLWLDPRGDLFATVSSWASLIREGWEESVAALLKVEDERSAARSIEIAKRLTRRLNGKPLVVRHARLFDPETLTSTSGTTIIIQGNRIESVGPDEKAALPADAEIIDAAGKSVIPGLWDMHQHFSVDDGLLDIASGVTTGRDLANDTDFILALRKKFDEGTAIGPRIILGGFLDGPGPYAGPTKVLVDSEEEIRKAIDRYASLGYEQIKVYSSIRTELVPFITRYAHQRGLRVSGHVPAFMRAEEAVRAGYDEIQHANMLLLNFMPDVKDTRTPVRFTAVAEKAAAIDLDSAEVKSFIELLRHRPCDPRWDGRNEKSAYRCSEGVVIDPTISIFEAMFTARRGVISPSMEPVAGRLPPNVRRGYLTGGLPVPEGMDQRYRDSFAKALELVRRLYDAGVPLVAGTDALSGFSLHRELELYAQAGIPPAAVLRIATLGAARIMHRDHILGSVKPGKLADLLIVDGDPATNISDVRKTVTVIKDGNVYDARAIYAELGVH